MMIERPKYLDKLIRKKENGLVKVITGIRRCGKSYLLFEIYHKYLNSIGVDDSHIIELALDDDENIRYRNPLELGKHIREIITDKNNMYYIFLDEIQKVSEINNPYLPDGSEKVGFVDVVLGLMKIKNADIYVTGSNSKMLSSDILTEFRGRGDEIRVNPLSYSEYYCAYQGDKSDAWKEYFTYGGMPLVLMQKTHEDKSRYLNDLFNKIYIDDIMARNSIGYDKSILEDLLNIISSSVGSLTNPSKLSKTFKSVRNTSVSDETIAKYLDYFIDAFMIYKSMRYDVKGRKYIGSPLKYYFSDIGLRNARLNFRQQEENHIMENIIYNELLYREFDVDVGIVEYNHKNTENKNVRTQLEIDFVANKGSVRYYIQSALNVSSEEKRLQETNSLRRVNDSFKKIVVVKDDIIPWYDDTGIYYIGIEKFLLEETL
ncbi:MAG: ATP-binding protein [Lachnospiraceae bacterium]|nr:ATP-binding protein [Lachnospiraceae bacterium]